MSSRTSTIQVAGLSKESLRALRSQAKAVGLPAEVYARHLIEEAISIEHDARTRTLGELWAPVQEEFRKSGMTEDDLDKLVDSARKAYHREKRRKKS